MASASREEFFTHKFAEWQLDQALDEAAAGTSAAFWHRKILILLSPGAPETLTSLAELFSTDSPPTLRHQPAFPMGAAAKYGLDEDQYKKTYWGLRPDFLIETDDLSILILVELKGGSPSQRTWDDPKELRYYNFLTESRLTGQKGFFYIVPAISKEDCEKCLRSYFLRDQSIRVGLILWEDLIEVISDKLVAVALDYIITNIEGVKILRSWQKAHTT